MARSRAGPLPVADLDTIEMIHAMDKTVPVIVVAKADSLDLERRARETRIFYYLVEPLQRDEVDAVIDDLASDARDVLGIESFVPLHHADYLPILELVSKAEAVIPRQRLSVP